MCCSFGLYLARATPAEEFGHGPDAEHDEQPGLPSPDAHSSAARGGHLPDSDSDAAANDLYSAYGEYDDLPSVWAFELHLMVTPLLISLVLYIF